jgi:FdhD protein
MTSRTARRRVRRIVLPESGAAPHVSDVADVVATEEPLGIRLSGQALTLTMRTPGDDIDLAAGFLVGEGIVRSPGDIASIRICDGTSCGHAGHEGTGNVADVELRDAVTAAAAPRRNFMTTSACGVCGKASVAELFVRPSWDINEDRAVVPATRLVAMPPALRDAQRVFASTGGLHAAAVFTADGELLAVREDVGRHNAVDKVVGWALREGRLPLRGCVLLVSGRASFELVQKAVLAGCPVLAAVSAPSSLAAELAQEAGLTLVGFLRGGSMNVYSGNQRVATDSLAGASCLEQAAASPDDEVGLGEDRVDDDADHQDHDHDRDRP